MDYAKMSQDDILNWCIENNQLDWLEAKTNETIEAEYYTKRIAVWDEEKQKNVYYADKTSPKVKKSIPITFLQIKNDFCEKFFPELLPEKKEKKLTLKDKIAAAKAAQAK